MSDYIESVCATPQGRPPKVTVATAEAVALRRAYIRSNRSEGLGSMAGAARWLAAKADGCLSTPVRDAILAAYSAGRAMPVEVRRALRAAEATVRHYRDPRALALDGIYAAGCLRMTIDEETGKLRRLVAGERWSVDDGSVNFGVCVPWPWGGDACSAKYGVRVGRFQLLGALDDSTHFCPGWSYIVRLRDSYRGDDIVWTLANLCRTVGKPKRMMIEGGAWQSKRALAFLSAAGIPWEDAKGRPHSKLIECWFNDLWEVLALETDGQVGRYRKENVRETAIMGDAQAGRIDPRRHFPMLESALDAIERAVAYKNAKDVRSDIYGHWVPQEDWSAGLKAQPMPLLEPGLEFLAARVREERTIGRFGQVSVAADSPIGEGVKYHFANGELLPFHGARVWVHFDPFADPVQATITLAAPSRDTPAGAVLARDVSCISTAPVLRKVISMAGVGYGLEFTDAIARATRAKREAAAVVRREMRATALDGARTVGISEVSAPDLAVVNASLGTRETENELARQRERAETNLAELEAFEREARSA